MPTSIAETADVTNITERTKTVAERMFAKQTPSVIADITDGVNSGLASLEKPRADVDKAHAKLVKAVTGIDKGIAGMTNLNGGFRNTYYFSTIAAGLLAALLLALYPRRKTTSGT